MGIITTATRMWLTKSTKPFNFTDEYDRKLAYEETKNMGLYVHIPFCKTICSFCPYCKVIYNSELCSQYIDSLLQEIRLVTAGQRQKKQVTSLYFGGGSPALAADRLGEIIELLKEFFIITEGIGVELHPSEVTVPRLKQLKSAGVTKISIGIQSFQNQFLQLLGRSKIDIEIVFEAIKQVPFETVSMDLIFALPGQTFELLKSDINKAFKNGADHIAIYPFIDFSFSDHRIAKIKNRDKRKLLDQITIYCKNKGYSRDSIWTFAKGQEKKYSSMTRENFLGFGCSATTLLEKQFKINTFSVEDYIRRIEDNELATTLTLRFTRRQRMLYWLFWTAYTTSVKSDDFTAFFQVPLEREFGKELRLAKGMGFLTEEQGTYRMTLKGAYYYHYYEGFYTLSYIDKMWDLLQKESFPHCMKL